MIPLALFLLAESPKAEAPKEPRSVELNEPALLKLENNALKFELVKRQLTELQQAQAALTADICKASGFAECEIDAQNRRVVEKKPK